MGRKFCRRGAVLVCECFVSTEEQKNIFEFGRFSYEAYVLVSGLFFYFGFWLLAVSFWFLALLYVMLKFAVKREQSQACLSYAEREQIEQS